MAQKAKCQQLDCNFAFDDAEHYEDALNKMRAHFRLEHRGKSFREHLFNDHYDSYNQTLDELVARELGVDWRARFPSPAPQVVQTCRLYVRYHRQYPRELLEELRALSAEHGTVLPELDAPEEDNAPSSADPFLAASNFIAAQSYGSPPAADISYTLDEIGEEPF